MIVDLFAGPGGWSEGLEMLGRTEIGIDNDQTACDTAELAGHQRVVADIHALDTTVAGRNIEGVIGSPPCPGFSAAGKGLGRLDFEMLLSRIDDIASGRDPRQVIDHARSVQHDKRSALTLEPLRWVIDLEPEWVALEQVPTVLPLWEAYADVLRLDGYSVWTGNVQAEQYGVPQTRRRAVLIASRSREVGRPEPTHSKFYPRSPLKLDDGVQKWVSMAEALGWGMTRRPSMTVTGGGTASGGAEPFGNAARQGMLKELGEGRWRVRGEPMIHVVNLAADVWQPVPAIDGETVEDCAWVHDRPSPTVVGSFAPDVVAKPGYRKAGDPPRQRTPGSVRITVQEAAVLQSFPADYPWRGKQGKCFQQVGNAVPPLLAAHVLAALGVGRLEVAA